MENTLRITVNQFKQKKQLPTVGKDIFSPSLFENFLRLGLGQDDFQFVRLLLCLCLMYFKRTCGPQGAGNTRGAIGLVAGAVNRQLHPKVCSIYTGAEVAQGIRDSTLQEICSDTWRQGKTAGVNTKGS